MTIMHLALAVTAVLAAGCKTSRPSDLSAVRSSSLFQADGTTDFFPLRSPFSGKVLDITNRGMQRGTLVQQWSFAGQGNQLWRIIANADDTVTFQVKHSNQCLDIIGFKGEDGAMVGQWDCNGKSNQKWKLRSRDGAFEIRSAWNNKCLDALDFQKTDGSSIGVWSCKEAANQLWTFGGPNELKPLLAAMDGSMATKAASPRAAGTPQQIVGTQAFGPAYQFTKDDPILESARAISALGSRMIKISAREGPVLNSILAMPFDTYFFWWRSASPWFDGLSAAEEQAEYAATYAFAKRLLTENAGLQRTFHLGHWEGDWYLLPDYNTAADPSPVAIDGMVQWLNVRQKAIEDARRDVPGSRSKVYHYTEVNRVRDAMVGGRKRLVNSVLPRVRVDYVSYSSYDVQQEPQATINATLDYIEGQMQPQAGLSGRRVFIGECGLSAKAVGYDKVLHEQRNRHIMIKFLSSNVPYILYWAMYNNEIKDGQQVGFWLINDKGEKEPLWFTLNELFQTQESSARNAAQTASPDIRLLSIQWLQQRP